jgi:hypothetical protein
MFALHFPRGNVFTRSGRPWGRKQGNLSEPPARSLIRYGKTSIAIRIHESGSFPCAPLVSGLARRDMKTLNGHLLTESRRCANNINRSPPGLASALCVVGVSQLPATLSRTLIRSYLVYPLASLDVSGQWPVYHTAASPNEVLITWRLYTCGGETSRSEFLNTSRQHGRIWFSRAPTCAAAAPKP